LKYIGKISEKTRWKYKIKPQDTDALHDTQGGRRVVNYHEKVEDDIKEGNELVVTRKGTGNRIDWTALI
jgi:hypothetical protein